MARSPTSSPPSIPLHPGLQDRVVDEEGNLRRFVNVFVDDDDVRYLDGLKTDVPDGQTVSIIPAVAGGLTPSLARLPRWRSRA